MPEKESADIERFIETLPDPAGARTFLKRLEAADPAAAKKSKGNPRLLSRMLTLAGNSPFLSETLLRHTEQISWLKAETERHFDRVKSVEQLSEELARFIARTIDGDDALRLARFKRRELLRIYLRDCLRVATLSEVTEELSNLADVILRYSLARSYQEMTKLHGAPLVQDQRGRIETAGLAIVALGKLGCRELNYASDIDLFFLYSSDGETAGDRGKASSKVTNKQFFIGVAERVVQMLGKSSVEGAVYRIDLRLRPYGRDGDLVWAVERAADYYRHQAHNWERQALIRARASAGSEELVSRFLEMVRDSIFTRDALPDTLDSVRRAKEKIDRKEAARVRGFNVKLGPGGIREIEFIAQALQLKHGGREPWVRSAQTLIVLARLAEKQYLTEPERTRLSAAYAFLRTIEHRLQMEHGAQTHTLPASRVKLEMLARRCGYAESSDLSTRFMKDLEEHTSVVRAIYDRVFGQTESVEGLAEVQSELTTGSDNEATRMVKQAAMRMTRVIFPNKIDSEAGHRQVVEDTIVAALQRAINPSRSLRNLSAWADSFATYAREQTRDLDRVALASRWLKLTDRLILILSSQYLSHLLLSRPMLASTLVADSPALRSDFFSAMRAALDRESDSASKTDALRRVWYRLVIEIGYKDLSAATSPSPNASERLREINLDQTTLAESALRIAVEIALESLGIKPSRSVEADSETSTIGELPATADRPPATDFPFAILGLGRLGHAGMDYGSDLDLLIVFDDSSVWPPVVSHKVTGIGDSPAEFYAKFTSQLVRVLSSITREGLLYRTDLRLRPEGKNGALAIGLANLVAYITERASAWEHSAYLKAREVAGDLKFGERVRKAICEASFDAASKNERLREELRDMHDRLAREKARSARPNIKWGRGGMTDVYFVTRYLQLRDRIYFPPELGTSELISHLGEKRSLDLESTRAMFEGYVFLRRLDHWMRLLLDRPSPALPASSIAMRDIARALGLPSVEAFEESFVNHTNEIDRVYNLIFG
jgi:glutamate-ammonia-ligase adenylyltransferase